jgi:hypothetical protein
MKECNRICEHKFNIETKNKITICKSCGVFKVDNKIFYKPEAFKTKNEFDKFSIIEKFKEQKVIDSDNKEYQKQRTAIIKYLKKFAAMCDYSNDTFYNCLYLIDLILSDKNNPFEKKLDQCVIGCLLLGGIY